MRKSKKKQPLYLLDSHCQLLGEQMEIDQAGQPSNIIWENIGINSYERYFRIFICMSIVLGITTIAFSIITKLKIESTELSNKYVDINCEKFSQIYSSQEILEQTAMKYIEEFTDIAPSHNFLKVPILVQ
jgi:hypothetical protein